MRSTGFWSKFVAGGMAVWFGMIMAAPAILHSCPQVMATSATAEATASHASHGAEHSGHRQPGAPVNCQCLGSCAVSAPAVLPTAPIVPVAVLTPVPPGLVLPTSLSAPVQHVDHLQPFATAPPFRLG